MGERPVRLCHAAVALATLLLAACTSAGDTMPLRVGVNPWIGYLPFQLAAERGLSPPPGVHPVDFASTSQVVRALENGNIEAGCMTLDEALTAADRLPDLRAVMVLDYSAGADGILALHDGADLHDMAGARIGVSNTTMGAYLLDRALDRAGLTRGAVTAVPVTSENEAEMVAKGRIDFLVTFEPMLSRIKRRGAHLVFSSADIPGEIVDVLVTREGTLTRRADDLRALARAWDRSVDRVSSTRARGALARLSGLGGNEIGDALAGLHFVRSAAGAEMLRNERSSLRSSARNLNLMLFEKGFVDAPALTGELFEHAIAAETGARG
ncbi:MAG TPA: ABC transporter substrate-binding protein [Gammaproteobacteria bacterium]|nr:ABC transporter substrate-binding protein [Gammaproteobacteria bacterium]